MSELTVKGFGGGITDFYIGASPDQYQKADNLIVDSYANLINIPGSYLDFTTNPTRARVPASLGSRRIGLLMGQEVGTGASFTILKQVVEKLHYDNGTTMAELVGPGAASAFDLSSPISAETAFAYAEWNKHTIITHESPFQKPVKVYRDTSGNLQLRTAGLPITATTYTATGGAGANYVYALVLKYTYEVGGIEYIDRSAPAFKSFTGIGTATPASSPGITVGSIPVLANADGEHYDTTNIKVEVYRTINNGTTLYYVGEVTNGTTSLADSVSDNTLVTNAALYTSGGEVENTRPPKCKYVHATSDFTYYANAIEVSTTGADLEQLQQRLYQSKRGDPDSVPASFYADMEEAITGISSVRSIPIVFCENSIYRIDGNFDNFGQGGMLPRKISDSVGAVGHLSLVQTLEGIFFAGNDGFYFTDGYSVTPINENFPDTYAPLVDSELKKKRIYGVHDIKNRFVLWATSYDDTEESSDNARIFCLDLRSKAFTTWSSGYQGDGPVLLTTGNISSTTISSLPATTGLEKGMLVVSEGMDPDTYIVSVDSSSQVTISQAGPTGTGVAIEFIENDKFHRFFKQFEPTALLYGDRKLWRADRKGFTLQYDPDTSSMPRLDESISGGGTVTLEELPLLFSYSSPALDLGTTSFRKWVNGVVIKARPRFDLTSDVTIQPYGENDDSGTRDEMEYIFFQPFYPWGTPLLQYGDPRLYARRRTLVDVKRRFTAGKLRCEYKTLHLDSAFVDRYQSLSYVQADISGTGITKTVTFTGTTLPSDIKDAWITFSSDSYVAEYRILSRDSNTQITILDPELALSATNDLDWSIRNYLSSSLIQLIEFTFFFEAIGASQLPYLGENKVNNQ